MVRLAENGTPSIKVICDDTDIFVLLIHFVKQKQLSCGVFMESPIAGRSIGASAAQHKDIAHHLPAAHALTGCDTVSYMFGIGAQGPQEWHDPQCI